MTTYTISELARAADVTPRTIRYYVAEQVLPGPNKDGRTAIYDPEHLARLQLIKLLKDEYLPLHEIRALLEGLDHQAVLDLLQEKQLAEKPSQPESSAKAYLKTLLNPSDAPSSPPTMMRHRAAKRKTDPLGQPPVVSGSVPKENASTESALEEQASTEMPSLFSLEQNEGTQAQVQSNTSSSLTAGGYAQSIESSNLSNTTQWQRIQITSDIELHIREDREKSNLSDKIQQLITIARQLFDT